MLRILPPGVPSAPYGYTPRPGVARSKSKHMGKTSATGFIIALPKMRVPVSLNVLGICCAKKYWLPWKTKSGLSCFNLYVFEN